MRAGSRPLHPIAAGPLSARVSASRRVWLLAVLLAIAAWPPASAIDNPDAPDRTAAFLARAQVLEAQVLQTAGGPAQGEAAAAYAVFLERELNVAYRLLLARLAGAHRQALLRSQRQWLAFRDAEYGFIDGNWTASNFGSSSAISRAGYRAALVKQRVLNLLDYLRNYGSAAPP